MKSNKSDMQKILQGDISLIEKFGSDDSEIIIRPHHVRKILKLYLNNKMTADELQTWADFFKWRSEIIDDETADFYEDMSTIIDRISTPFLDGALTYDRASQYLTELNRKYPDK